MKANKTLKDLTESQLITQAFYIGKVLDCVLREQPTLAETHPDACELLANRDEVRAELKLRRAS